jgi:hypothetical protein
VINSAAVINSAVTGGNLCDLCKTRKLCVFILTPPKIIENIEAFPKLQFWESNLEIPRFCKALSLKNRRACPKTVRISAQSISFGTGSIIKAFSP